jgi:hypothetical protein
MVKWDPTRKISGKSLQSLGRGSWKRRRKWRQASAQHYGVKEQSTFYVTNAQQLAVLTFHHDNSPFARLNYEHINSGCKEFATRGLWLITQMLISVLSSKRQNNNIITRTKNPTKKWKWRLWTPVLVISFSTWLSIRLSTLITYQVVTDFLRTGK